MVASCVTVLLFAVRSNSIWMDEAQTYSVVSHGWDNMLRSIFLRRNAISGMPLYFLLEFGWCKIFGYGEFALRSMNYIFAALTLAGSYKILHRNGLSKWMMPLFALHPVFLYYMNEARPYAALYTCGLWCFYFLSKTDDGWTRRELMTFILVFWFGCALHMMFVFLGIAYLFRVIWEWRNGKFIFRDHLLSWLCLLPLFLPLAVHYFNVVIHAPEVHSHHPQAVASILQIGYYFLGLGGLGWSRNDLRNLQLDLKPQLCLSLLATLFTYGIVVFYFLRYKLFRNRKQFLPLLGSSCALGCFILVNIVLRTRFWERHAIFLLPGLLMFLAGICTELCSQQSRLSKLAAGCLLAFILLSGLNIISLYYYQKDDHKGALEVARSYHPDHIFFQGDIPTFAYYGLKGELVAEIHTQGTTIEHNINISNIHPGLLSELLTNTQGKTILLLSEKPDFDQHRLYNQFSSNGIRRNSFVIVSAPL